MSGCCSCCGLCQAPRHRAPGWTESIPSRGYALASSCRFGSDQGITSFVSFLWVLVDSHEGWSAHYSMKALVHSAPHCDLVTEWQQESSMGGGCNADHAFHASHALDGCLQLQNECCDFSISTRTHPHLKQSRCWEDPFREIGLHNSGLACMHACLVGQTTHHRRFSRLLACMQLSMGNGASVEELLAARDAAERRMRAAQNGVRSPIPAADPLMPPLGSGELHFLVSIAMLLLPLSDSL